MRGLRKPWKPRNVSPSDQEARTMQQAEADFLAELTDLDDLEAAKKRARSTFDSLEKSALRALLFEEQGHVCVYCERRIREAHPPPRVEHWRPLSKNPTLALCWANMYLSCTAELTCDKRKQETSLREHDDGPELPWPVDHRYEQSIGFTSLGEMYVRSDAPLDDDHRRALKAAIGQPHTADIKDNGVLNLNHPTLVAARAAVINAEGSRLRRDYEDRTASREERERRASELLQAVKLPEYVSARVGWLRRSLGKNRT